MAKAPSPPSYAKVVKAIKKTQRVAQKQAKKQLQFAKQFYADAQAMNKNIITDLDEIRSSSMANMGADRARLEGTYWDLEDEQISEINQYQQRAADFDAEVAQMKADAIAFKSEANQQYMAGKAVSQVGQTFAAERQAAERALTDRGVNPNSGASASLTAGLRMAEGAAQAAAGTQAADATRQEGEARLDQARTRQLQAAELASTGLQLQKGMVDVGRTYPAQIAQDAATAGTAGAQAIDQTIAVADARNKAVATAQDWSRIGVENTRTWTDALDTGFRNKLGLYEANLKAQELEQQSSSGIGGALGAIAGVARGFIPGFEGGGFIGQELADGGGVNDPNLSDTGGSTGNWSPTGRMAAASQPAAKSTDTAPAVLTPGEFVVPKHVVEWKGQEYFQKLIKSAPEQKQQMIAQTGAKPTMHPVGQGAIPI